MDWIIDEFKKEQGIDLKQDKMALQRLKETAEKAKIELSTAQETEINLPFITADASGPKHLVKKISRAKLEQLINDLLKLSVEPCKLALKDAGLSASDIDTVRVYQGEREMAADNKLLGNFELVGIPPAPRGIPQIEVVFDIDANGILHVSAKDLGTGKEQSIRITASSGLSEDEIDRMVKDADIHAGEDKKKKQIIEVKNEADTLVYSVEKTLKEHGDKISEPERKDVEDALERCKNLKDTSNDPDEIRSAIEALTAASHKLAEHMYKETASQQGAASSGCQHQEKGAKTAGEEEVVDAEFENVA